MHRLVVVFLVALMLAGCASRPKTLNFLHGDSYFLEESISPTNAEFERIATLAKSGDEAALAQIIRWERLTDGEGALNYSMMLYKLRAFVGVRKFDRVLNRLPEIDQKRTKSSLKFAKSFEEKMRDAGLR